MGPIGSTTSNAELKCTFSESSFVRASRIEMPRCINGSVKSERGSGRARNGGRGAALTDDLDPTVGDCDRRDGHVGLVPLQDTDDAVPPSRFVLNSPLKDQLFPMVQCSAHAQ